MVFALVVAASAFLSIASAPASMPPQTPIGTVTNFGMGVNAPRAVALGPDGNVWFTNYGGVSIGHITPAGVITNLTGAGIVTPRGIAAGADGNLWFTNETNNSIGRITPAGIVTNYTGWASAPNAIAAGPDGNIWFTNFASIVRVARTEG